MSLDVKDAASIWRKAGTTPRCPYRMQPLEIRGKEALIVGNRYWMPEEIGLKTLIKAKTLIKSCNDLLKERIFNLAGEAGPISIGDERCSEIDGRICSLDIETLNKKIKGNPFEKELSVIFKVVKHNIELRAGDIRDQNLAARDILFMIFQIQQHVLTVMFDEKPFERPRRFMDTGHPFEGEEPALFKRDPKRRPEPKKIAIPDDARLDIFSREIPDGANFPEFEEE